MTDIKKLFFSLFVVGLVSVMAFGATRAYFTAEESVMGNTIAAGRLDLDLREEVSHGITLTGLMPSQDQWTNPMKLEVYNTSLSSEPVKYRFYSELDTESEASFYDKLRVIVRHDHATETHDPFDWPIVYEGPLKDMMIVSNETSGIISETLGVNDTHVYYLQFRLASTAGNEYQGASATFDIHAEATQEENPGWTE